MRSSDIRAARAGLDDLAERAPKDDAHGRATARVEATREAMTAVEEALYQTKNESRQDPLNFPIRLTDKLAGVKGVAAMGAFAPTAQSYAVRDELTANIEAELADWATLRDEALPRIDALARELAIPRVTIGD